MLGRGLPFDLCVGMDGFEDNLARALTNYLTRPDQQRRQYAEVARRNSVGHLSWTTLADRVVTIAGGRR